MFIRDAMMKITKIGKLYGIVLLTWSHKTQTLFDITPESETRRGLAWYHKAIWRPALIKLPQSRTSPNLAIYKPHQPNRVVKGGRSLGIQQTSLLLWSFYLRSETKGVRFADKLRPIGPFVFITDSFLSEIVFLQVNIEDFQMARFQLDVMYAFMSVLFPDTIPLIKLVQCLFAVRWLWTS